MRKLHLQTYSIILISCFMFILYNGLPVYGQSPASAYKVVAKIAIGGEGGWDYLAVDPAARRLYVSHATRVNVVDIEKNTVIGEIPNTNGVHGIAIAVDLGYGFTSNGRDSTVTVFDLKKLETITTVKVTGENPDAILYEPVTHRVFTFNGRTSNATAIDAKTNKVIDTVSLGGRPEFAVADNKGKVFVNLEDKSAIVTFDAQTLKVEGTWPLAPCEEPSGLAIDREHRRLFSGCRNKMMAVVNADTGKVIATPPIGSGVDACAYDPATGLAFSSNGEGTLTVIHEDTPYKFSVVENAATQPRARTMALDEKTHRVFLSTAEFGPAPAPTPEQPRPRPTIVPNTFAVLVLAR